MAFDFAVAMKENEERMKKESIERKLKKEREAKEEEIRLSACEDCGIKITDGNRHMTMNNMLETVPSGLCNSCAEIRHIKALEEEEKLRQHKREDKRMAIDSFLVREVNFKIPAMYHNVEPHLYDVRMKEPTALIYGDFGTGKTYAGYGYVKYERLRSVPSGVKATRGVNYSELKESLGKDYLIHDIMLPGGENFALDEITLRRAFTIMKELKDGMRAGESEKIFNRYLHRKILVIDEYGKNMSSDYEESTLFELINTRYEELKQTILIVNASSKNELLNIVRPDILDRFRGNLIEMSGNSRR
jgi:DNA replication protein DnaC